MNRYQIIEICELSDENKMELKDHYEDDLVLVDVLNNKVLWVNNSDDLPQNLETFVNILNEQENRMDELEQKLREIENDLDMTKYDLRTTQRRVEYVHDAPSW